MELPKKVLGKETEQVLSAPSPASPQDDRKAPHLSGRFWRGEGTGVGKSRQSGPGMLASPTCPVQSSAWGHPS